jgi:hypothetical protein
MSETLKRFVESLRNLVKPKEDEYALDAISDLEDIDQNETEALLFVQDAVLEADEKEEA